MTAIDAASCSPAEIEVMSCWLSHADLRVFRPVALGQVALRRDRRCDRVGRAREDGDERVTLGLDLEAVAGRYHRAEQPMVLAQHARAYIPPSSRCRRRDDPSILVNGMVSVPVGRRP